MEMGGMTAEQVDALVLQAEERALEAEQQAEEAKRLKKESDRQTGAVGGGRSARFKLRLSKNNNSRGYDGQQQCQRSELTLWSMPAQSW